MASFAWTFPQFIVDPFSAGLKNVVVAINWVCTGTDQTTSSTASGTVNLPSPSPAQFIPYNQITQELAFQWVSGLISVQAVEDNIAVQIAQISVPQLQPQLPPF